MQKHKLFVAIELPPCVLDEVERLQTILKESELIDARYPRREHLHITLAFIGFVNANQIPKIKELLIDIVWHTFIISLHEMHYFTQHQLVNVVYISLLSKELVALGNEIQKQLRHHDLYHDTRLYVPHLTIARVNKVYEPILIKKILKTCKVEPCSFDVQEFVLKLSLIEDCKLTHQTLLNVSVHG